MVVYFGVDRPLALITPGDADRFAEHLRTSYAAATVAKTIKTARQMLRRAVRLRLLPENPFDGIKAGSERNPARNFFVSREVTEAVLAACPDPEWRLIVALARYGGLRCPSELLKLTGADILWDQDRFVVRSPKTAARGKAERLTPLFPELRPYLEEGYLAASEGATYVITRYRDSSQNLRAPLMDNPPRRPAALGTLLPELAVVARDGVGGELPGPCGDELARELAARCRAALPPDDGGAIPTRYEKRCSSRATAGAATRRTCRRRAARIAASPCWLRPCAMGGESALLRT
jgi:hypothetical protein